MGDDGIDMLSGLDSISNLPSGDQGDDGATSSGGELGRMTKIRHLSVRKKVLEYSGDCRLAYTSLRGNFVSGVTMRGKRKDVFLLSRRDGVHIGTGEC